MSELPKYAINTDLWMVLAMEPTRCTVIRYDRDKALINGKGDYLVTTDLTSDDPDETHFWRREEELYGTEADAIHATCQLWEQRRVRLAEESDKILRDKIYPLQAKAKQLEEDTKHLSNRTIKDGYYTVSAGQTFSGTVVTNRGCHIGIEGGTMRGLYVTSSAIVHLMSGMIENFTVDLGAAVVADGGHLVSACISGGSLSITGIGSKTPYLQGATISDGADVYLSDAVASWVWVRAHSKMTLGQDAEASAVTIGMDGEVAIHADAGITSCMICSGGTLTMYGGGHIANLNVNDGGIVRYLEQKK